MKISKLEIKAQELGYESFQAFLMDICIKNRHTISYAANMLSTHGREIHKRIAKIDDESFRRSLAGTLQHSLMPERKCPVCGKPYRPKKSNQTAHCYDRKCKRIHLERRKEKHLAESKKFHSPISALPKIKYVQKIDEQPRSRTHCTVEGCTNKLAKGNWFFCAHHWKAKNSLQSRCDDGYLFID